jgi:hypothetical protein
MKKISWDTSNQNHTNTKTSGHVLQFKKYSTPFKTRPTLGPDEGIPLLNDSATKTVVQSKESSFVGCVENSAKPVFTPYKPKKLLQAGLSFGGFSLFLEAGIFELQGGEPPLANSWLRWDQASANGRLLRRRQWRGLQGSECFPRTAPRFPGCCR